jgi:hypothetical protein
MMKRIQKKGLFFHEDEDEKRKAGRVASKDGEISEVFLNRNEGRKMYAADARNHPDVTIEQPFDVKTYKRKSDGFFPIDDNCETEKRLGICKVQVSSNDDDDARERTRCNITFCLFV